MTDDAARVVSLLTFAVSSGLPEPDRVSITRRDFIVEVMLSPHGYAAWREHVTDPREADDIAGRTRCQVTDGTVVGVPVRLSCVTRIDRAA